MRTFLTYFKLELKRTLKSLPYFFAGAIVLVLLAGTIAFSASKMLYGEKALGKINVGVAMPENDRLAQMAMSMVASLDSVGSLCEFSYVEEEEGRKLLENGEIFALMQIPRGLLEGIMDGRNIPVTITFPENSGLEAAVFKELTEAGTSILGTAQAAIYSTDDFLKNHQLESFIGQAERELNTVFMRYALSREGYFRTVRVSASGDVTTAVFYGISASVMILLLLGIPAAPIVRPYKLAVEQRLTLCGIGRVRRTAVRTASLTMMLLLASALPLIYFMAKGYFDNTAAAVCGWFFVCLAAAGWILLIYELCQNTTAAILLLFFSTAVMLFISGGIIPSVFLPEAVGALGKWMPSSFLSDGIRWMLGGGELLPVLKLILLEGIVFSLSSAVRRKGYDNG